MHYFLLGPSGVGKTTFGDWLHIYREYLHIAIDCGDTDGMIAEGLAEPWAKLRQGDPAPFTLELQERAKAKGMKGCVLTFWSVIFISPDTIGWLAKYDIAVRYLYGPKELCIQSFVRREARPDRNRAFWSENNKSYEAMGGLELAPYRANVIKPSGERLTGSEIAKLLKIE
jgi:hypothetical protein